MGLSPRRSSSERREVEDRGIPEGWTQPGFDDREWELATEYTAAEAINFPC